MLLQQFIEELKGRGVYRVTAYYSAGAWVLLQVADVVFPALELPEWSITAVLVVAAVGFPIALVLAWMFDLTPEGVVEAHPVAAETGPHPWSRSHIIEFTLIIVLALLVGYLYLERLADQASATRPADAGPTSQATSIAVMPFVNMSDVADMEYLGDGLAEEILNLLAKLNELNVAARTSSFYFKGKDADIQTIGEHLGVEHVLEGSVRHHGNRVRVTAQLIKASDGFHLWSETYDRDLSDLFKVQDEIARKVVESLHILLPSANRGVISTKTNVDPAAYDYYLQGRAYLRSPRDASNYRIAVDLFEKAARASPKFADAYAGLCDGLLGLYAIDLDQENFTAAEAACHRALTLDRRAASVYIALGNLYRTSGQYEKAVDEFNMALSLNPGFADAYVGLGDTYLEADQADKAEPQYQRAIDLQPKYWHALMRMGNYLFRTGRMEEAIPYYMRISELMPESESAFNNLGAARFIVGDFELASAAWHRSLELAPSDVAYSNLATSLYFLGRFDEALTLYHKAVELAPDRFEIWGNLGDAYRHSEHGVEMAEPMYANAIKLAKKRLEINESDAETLSYVGHYHASIGQRAEALSYIDRAMALAPGSIYVNYNCATALAALGEPEQAVEALERALQAGYPLHIVLADANLENLRELPSFNALTANGD